MIAIDNQLYRPWQLLDYLKFTGAEYLDGERPKFRFNDLSIDRLFCMDFTVQV